MMGTTITETVDGFTYEGRWMSASRNYLHVTGPLEYRRPVRAMYVYETGEWVDGPTGRPSSPRTKRYWTAANRLAATFRDAVERQHPVDPGGLAR